MMITSQMPPLTITPTEPCPKCGRNRWAPAYDVQQDGWRCICGRVVYPVCVGGAWVVQYEPRMATELPPKTKSARPTHAKREATVGSAVRLRQAREARGWTVNELAERSSVSKATIKGYESGRRSGYRGTWLLLADALGCSVEELLG